MSLAPSSDGRKSVGAYYTPPLVAAALCRWALRPGDGRALDPSAGDGAFVLAAAQRLQALGGEPGGVLGIELRPAAAAQARARLEAARLGSARLRVADFLALRSTDLSPVDAVVGNPPYVRFQRLPAERRRRAADVAAAAGVHLDALASSWAAFVPHAATFLRRGGRLALVLPAELGHARYARPVLAFLRRRFATVTFVLFRSALFPRLDQGALVLLADGYDEPFVGFQGARLVSAAALDADLGDLPAQPLDADALVGGGAYLHHAWLAPDVAGLVSRLTTAGRASRLGSHARVRIGYVTGHNGFFNLGAREARARSLDPRHLRRAVFRGRALRGALFEDEDWAYAAQTGDAGWLFDPADPGDPAVAAYLREGEALGVPSRAKVARRTPWYRVTRTQPPELLLTAMAGGSPRLALPRSPVAASNTLHGVWRLSATPAASAEALALAALSSLTELSAELEGHALGGGLLKLEPSEALRLLLPLPGPGAPAAAAGPAELPPERVETLLIDADARLRRGDTAGARAVADGALLAWWPELGPGGAGRLAAAAAELRALRTGRGA